MNPPLPKRLGKKTRTKAIDGSPFVYTVVDEEIFLANSNSNKAYCLHKIRHEDGREKFRIGYYMIAHKPRMKGKWAWGQYAPIMTQGDLKQIVNRLKAKGWI